MELPKYVKLEGEGRDREVREVGGDLQAFAAMLNRAGVKWELIQLPQTKEVAVYIEARDGERNLGYSGFGTDFTFSKADGSLQTVGVWE